MSVLPQRLLRLSIQYTLSALCLRLTNAHTSIKLEKKLGVELNVGSHTRTRCNNLSPGVAELRHAMPRIYSKSNIAYLPLLPLTRDDGVTEFRFGLSHRDWRRRVTRPEKIYLMAYTLSMCTACKSALFGFAQPPMSQSFLSVESQSRATLESQSNSLLS